MVDAVLHLLVRMLWLDGRSRGAIGFHPQERRFPHDEPAIDVWGNPPQARLLSPRRLQIDRAQVCRVAIEKLHRAPDAIDHHDLPPCRHRQVLRTKKTRGFKVLLFFDAPSSSPGGIERGHFGSHAPSFAPARQHDKAALAIARYCSDPWTLESH